MFVFTPQRRVTSSANGSVTCPHDTSERASLSPDQKGWY